MTLAKYTQPLEVGIYVISETQTDCGLSAFNGWQEKSIVLDISKEMKKYLDDNYTDHETILTRATNVFIELSERATIANKDNADVFVNADGEYDR
ncbi:N-acetylmuramoyl-L-alanine amidase family protein [Peribacillus loiseleuriae]|uniref:N-acetylmuramoyl-L-alanine amidase family protein n=1 Tax=Peribacillus loiseleuriae TaxID=1679170 RepID=UPI003D03099F